MTKDKTLKAKAIDFVESNGKATWKEIHDFILAETSNWSTDIRPENRGSYSSYFSGSSFRGAKKGVRDSSSHGLLMRRSKNDPRYLKKEGKYYFVTVGPYEEENLTK